MDWKTNFVNTMRTKNIQAIIKNNGNLHTENDDFDEEEKEARNRLKYVDELFENGFFQKSISYTKPNGSNELHIELVKAWNSDELSKLLFSVGLHVKTIKGDYDFSEYHNDSPRMILIAEKK